MMISTTFYRQIQASSMILFSSFVYGCKEGYLQAVAPIFMSSNSPFDVTPENISWIASVSFIGTVGAIITLYFVRNLMSSRLLLFICAITASIVWLSILLTASAASIMASLCIYGMAYSIIEVVGCIYFGEIATPVNRELLGLMFAMANFLGTQVEILFAVFDNYRLLCFFPFICSIVCALLVIFVIESPYHLMASGLQDEAAKNLYWLNDKSMINDISEELDQVKKYVDEQRERRETDLRIGILLPENLRLIAVMVVIDGASVITCGTILTMYGALVVDDFKYFINKKWFVNVRALVALLGALFSWFIIKKFDRRVTIMFGFFMSGVLHMCLAICYYVDYQNGNSVEYLAYVIVALLLIFTGLCNSIIYTIVDILKSEVFPYRLKEFSVCLLTIVDDVSYFVVVKFYIAMSASWGVYSLMLIYSLFSFVALVLVYWFIPDTKGKTLDEIRNEYTSVHGSQNESLQVLVN